MYRFLLSFILWTALKRTRTDAERKGCKKDTNVIQTFCSFLKVHNYAECSFRSQAKLDQSKLFLNSAANWDLIAQVNRLNVLKSAKVVSSSFLLLFSNANFVMRYLSRMVLALASSIIIFVKVDAILSFLKYRSTWPLQAMHFKTVWDTSHNFWIISVLSCGPE